MDIKSLSIVLILLLKAVTPARILCLFIVPAPSRQTVYQEIIEEFAKRGHELVVVRPKSIAVYSKNVTYIETELPKEMSNEVFGKHGNSRTVAPSTMAWIVYIVMNKVIETMYDVPSVQELLNDNTKFDFILTEGAIKASHVLNSKFRTPIVIVSSFYGSASDFHSVGVPVHPLLYPDFYFPKVWRHSLWDEISMVILNTMSCLLSWQADRTQNNIIERLFGEKAPTIQELQHHVAMLVMNVDQIWDCNRPVLPTAMYIGSINLRKPKALPDDLQNFLDKSKYGVIYLSFGTVVQTSELSSELIQLFMNVFGALPYNILWKWDAEEPVHLPENIRMQKVYPQQDLLYHPKIKIFITHGGLSSTAESIAANVPLIGIPFRVDQFMNVQKYQKFSIGVQLDIDNLTEDGLKSAIIEVAENKRENIRKLNIILEEQRSGALQHAVRMIERTVEFGGEHFRSPLALISFTDYFVLDVFIPLVATSAALVIVISLITWKLFRRVNKSFRRLLKLR